MKLVTLSAFLLLSSVCSATDIVQTHFENTVASSEKVIVNGRLNKKSDRYDFYVTENKEEISDIIDSIEFIDPKPVYDDEGNEEVVLSCFCAGEYSITFIDKDGKRNLYSVKHEISALTPPNDHGLGYSADVSLTKESSKKLKRFIRKAKRNKTANVAVE